MREINCSYDVRLKDGSELSCDGCNVRNFRLFFKCCKREIVNCVVWLSNGDGWIYYYGRFKWRWEKFKSGKKKVSSLF